MLVEDDPGDPGQENYNSGYWDCAEYAIRLIETATGDLQEVRP